MTISKTMKQVEDRIPNMSGKIYENNRTTIKTKPGKKWSEIYKNLYSPTI